MKKFKRMDLPVVTNIDFGHTDPMIALPYRRIMQINVDEKQIAILENGVL